MNRHSAHQQVLHSTYLHEFQSCISIAYAANAWGILSPTVMCSLNVAGFKVNLVGTWSNFKGSRCRPLYKLGSRDLFCISSMLISPRLSCTCSNFSPVICLSSHRIHKLFFKGSPSITFSFSIFLFVILAIKLVLKHCHIPNSITQTLFV